MKQVFQCLSSDTIKKVALPGKSMPERLSSTSVTKDTFFKKILGISGVVWVDIPPLPLESLGRVSG